MTKASSSWWLILATFCSHLGEFKVALPVCSNIGVHGASSPRSKTTFVRADALVYKRQSHAKPSIWGILHPVFMKEIIKHIHHTATMVYALATLSEIRKPSPLKCSFKGYHTKWNHPVILARPYYLIKICTGLYECVELPMRLQKTFAIS